jgi:hypothetical protein
MHGGHDSHDAPDAHGSHGAEGASTEAWSFDAPMWVAGAIGIGAGLLIALCFVFAGALH